MQMPSFIIFVFRSEVYAPCVPWPVTVTFYVLISTHYLICLWSDMFSSSHVLRCSLHVGLWEWRDTWHWLLCVWLPSTFYWRNVWKWVNCDSHLLPVPATWSVHCSLTHGNSLKICSPLCINVVYMSILYSYLHINTKHAPRHVRMVERWTWLPASVTVFHPSVETLVKVSHAVSNGFQWASFK